MRLNMRIRSKETFTIGLLFSLLLLSMLQTVERTPIFPNMPILILAALFIAFSVELINKGIDLKFIKSHCFLAFNLFGLLITISALYSEQPHLTFLRAVQYFVISNCLLIVYDKHKSSYLVFTTLSKLILIYTLAACIYAIIVFEFGTIHQIDNTWRNSLDIFGMKYEQLLYGNRVSSFLGNPNRLGMLIMISSILCLYFWSLRRNILWLLVLVIFLYTLKLSGSRASLLGLTVGSVFFINYNCLKQNSLSTAIRIAITSGVLILALYIAINPEVVELIFSIIGRESTTLSRRDIAWNMLIKQFQSTPFFGVGYRISTEAILVKNNIPISNSHNVYLRSEEHTSELQSRGHLVCRLLLEKKK